MANTSRGGEEPGCRNGICSCEWRLWSRCWSINGCTGLVRSLLVLRRGLRQGSILIPRRGGIGKWLVPTWILLLVLIIHRLHSKGWCARNSRGVLDFLIVCEMPWGRRWLQKNTRLVASLGSTSAEAKECSVKVKMTYKCSRPDSEPERVRLPAATGLVLAHSHLRPMRVITNLIFWFQFLSPWQSFPLQWHLFIIGQGHTNKSPIKSHTICVFTLISTARSGASS